MQEKILFFCVFFFRKSEKALVRTVFIVIFINQRLAVNNKITVLTQNSQLKTSQRIITWFNYARTT